MVKQTRTKLLSNEFLTDWFSTDLGQTVLDAEQSVLNKMLESVFGYYLLLPNWLPEYDCVKNSPVILKMPVYFNYEASLVAKHIQKPLFSPTCGDLMQLPYASESIDAIFLPHVLDFHPDPAQLLHECRRVLRNDGQMIITGFNPVSWFGIWKLMHFYHDQGPWAGHFLSIRKLKRWLKLLDCRIEEQHNIFHALPFANAFWRDKTNYLTNMVQWGWKRFAGIYIIRVKPCVKPLTPMKLKWRKGRLQIDKPIIEPSASTITE